MSRGGKIVVNILAFLVMLAWGVWSIAIERQHSDKVVVSGYRVIVSDSAEVRFISSGEILRMLSDSLARYGTPVDSLALRTIEQRFESLDCIADAEVSVTMDGVLTVRAEQRRAVMRLMGDRGEDFYVDNSLELIVPRANYRPVVPLITGEFESECKMVDSIAKNYQKWEIERSFLKKIHTFVEDLAADDFFRDFTEQIYIAEEADSDEISAVIIPRAGGATIRFGALSNAKEKLEKIKIFYSQAYKYAKLDRGVDVVDVRFKDQVVVTPTE